MSSVNSGQSTWALFVRHGGAGGTLGIPQSIWQLIHAVTKFCARYIGPRWALLLAVYVVLSRLNAGPARHQPQQAVQGRGQPTAPGSGTRPPRVQAERTPLAVVLKARVAAQIEPHLAGMLDSVALAAAAKLTDPDMPAPVQRAVAQAVDSVLPLVKVAVLRALRHALVPELESAASAASPRALPPPSVPRLQPRALAMAQPAFAWASTPRHAPSWKAAVCGPQRARQRLSLRSCRRVDRHSLRALQHWAMHTLAPADRSSWWQLRQPAWWGMTVLGAVPGLGAVWWCIVWAIRPRQDAYMLADFIASSCAAQAVGAGLWGFTRGAAQYAACVHFPAAWGPCHTHGPSLGIFAACVSSMYIAAVAHAWAKLGSAQVQQPWSAAERAAPVANKTADQAGSDAPAMGDSRLQCASRWLPCCACRFRASWASFRAACRRCWMPAHQALAAHGPYTATACVYWSVVTWCALLALLGLVHAAWTGAVQAWELHAALWWLRTLYSLLLLPFLMLKVPLGLHFLVAGSATGMSADGRVVPRGAPARPAVQPGSAGAVSNQRVQ